MSGFNIAEVFTQSLRFLFRHLRVALILGILPYGLLLAAMLFAEYALFEPVILADWPAEPFALDGLTLVFPESGTRIDMSPIFFQGMLLFLIELILPIPFKVAWLRYALLGPDHQPVRIGYRFGDREIRFLGYTIVLYLALFAVLIAVGTLGSLVAVSMQSEGPMLMVMLVGIGLTIWLAARLYFRFPSLAMDLPGGFTRAWAESRGQAFKLLVLTAMVALLFKVPAFLIVQLFAGLPIVGLVLVVAIGAVADAALWTALGFAYWKTTGVPGPGGANAVVPPARRA